MINLNGYLDGWLDRQRCRLQPATWRNYESVTRLYLRPRFDKLPLDEVGHDDLTQLYQELVTVGGARGEPLALPTVKAISLLVNKAFSDAVRTDALTSNPNELASVPRVHPTGDPPELRVWTVQQLLGFLDDHRDHPHHLLWVVAAGTGMRRGELLGMRWRDVDEGATTLYVRGSLSVVDGVPRLKGTASDRARALHVGPTVLDALRSERKRAKARRHVPVTADPEDPGAWDLVFTSRSGLHIGPQWVTDAFRRAVRRAPQPDIRFHDLRHTHATLLLQAGVPPKVVAERLGHAHIQTTLDIYAEVLPAMDQDAADHFEAHVWGDQ